ncbi:hypothetical protein BDK51DRAFT_38724 [Blyttiomyces helicus]|uniref:Uncharacterized protein n=1 Tax=Blyttiomyces helicus TaxID=388810 RepID=A0A4P9WJM1_9FUNG|nr:hypothetical protein BDK51DRAFT_38724 [Blyttiomyces helicus]|eukprot:RKO92153.1 hypothetical protein BDK51DRAFT_38724 [Blyttiomyces helicus]
MIALSNPVTAILSVFTAASAAPSSNSSASPRQESSRGSIAGAAVVAPDVVFTPDPSAADSATSTRSFWFPPSGRCSPRRDYLKEFAFTLSRLPDLDPADSAVTITPHVYKQSEGGQYGREVAGPFKIESWDHQLHPLDLITLSSSSDAISGAP